MGQRRSYLVFATMMLATMLILPRISVASSPAQPSMSRRVFLPVITSSRPPPITASYYITGVTTPEEFGKLGCAAAYDLQQRRGNSGVVILFFGRPAYTPIVGAEPGGYGTRLLNDLSSYASIPQIRTAVQAWIDGYLGGYFEDATFRCVTSPGDIPRITLVVATTNEAIVIDGPLARVQERPDAGDPDPTIREHGVAWGQLINNLGQYILQKNGSDYLSIGGGNDIELAWNGPVDTRNWVDGYYTLANYRLFIAGSCDGCPEDPKNAPGSGNYSYGWTAQDIWTVITQGITQMIPQMYNEAGAQARQWSTLATVTQALGSISYAGALTQFQACIDRADNDPCTMIKNTPETGWSQFTQALASQNHDPRLPWLTDVRWEFDATPFQKGGSS